MIVVEEKGSKGLMWGNESQQVDTIKIVVTEYSQSAWEVWVREWVWDYIIECKKESGEELCDVNSIFSLLSQILLLILLCSILFLAVSNTD